VYRSHQVRWFGLNHLCVCVDTNKPPLSAMCCHLANELTILTGDRQTNHQSDKQKDIVFPSRGLKIRLLRNQTNIVIVTVVVSYI